MARTASGVSRRPAKHGEAGGVSQRDWSNLPATALLCISQRLTDFVDYFAFGGVCGAWRSVSKPDTGEFMESQGPLLCTSGHHFYSFSKDRFYRNVLSGLELATASVLLGFSHGYLILGDGRFRPGISVVNPFTRGEVGPIPRLPSGYVVFWAVLTGAPTSTGWVLLLLGKFGCEVTIFYWRAGCRRWFRWQAEELKYDGGFGFPAVLDGAVYAWSNVGKPLKFEFAPLPQVTLLEVAELPDGSRSHVALVASHGEILAVVGPEYIYDDDPMAPWSFAVYRLDLSERKWARLRNLGDRSLFSTPWISFVLSDDHPAKWGGKANCIYHPHIQTEKTVLRVFHMEKGHTETLPFTIDPPGSDFGDGCSCIEYLWFLPSLCC